MAKIRGTDAGEFLNGTNGDDEIDGEGGNDFILGRRGDDIIRGGAGNDFILAGRGDDFVDGGSGDDVILGDRGDDTVEGGAGNDTILGERGNDTLNGGAGDDVIDGGRGDDIMDGGEGSDTYRVGGRRDGVDTFNDSGTGEGDYDVIEATGNNTRIQMTGFGPENGIEEITGNGFSNVDIRGDNAANVLDFSATTLSGIQEIEARGGADTVIGSDGDDTIDAGSGNDVVTGGAGDDTIDGGTGTDTVFYSGSIFDYDIQRTGGTTTVTDLNGADGDDGSDTLQRVEVAQFSDFTLFLNQNNGPVAVDDTVSVGEDSGLNIAIADLLTNDRDFDGDTLAFAGIDTSATLGTVSVNSDGTLSYDPNGAFESLGEGETATDSFTYTISDGEGGFATGTVTVTVAGANDAPVATDDDGAVNEGEVLTVDANGVLSNDRDPDASDTLTVGAVEGSADHVGQTIELASGALLTMNADGSYSYDPNGAFDGLDAGETATDTFTYTVSDGHGGYPEPVQRTLIDETFEGGAGGFAYLDDAFRGTGEPAYADGNSGAGLGQTGNGLQIVLGGQDNADIQGMSGGWATTFTVPEDAAGTLTFSYNMSLAPNYEAGEFAQVLVSVDGALYGTGGNDYVAELSGDGNGGSVTTTGWQTVTIDLGQLTAGDHTLVIGGYNNEKTFNDESVDIRVDDIQLTTDSTPMVQQSLLDEGFDGGAGGFSYVGDAFRDTAEPDYAGGAWGAGLGESGGGLQIVLGGQDNDDILGMSGGWQTTITVPDDASGTLSFRYNMTASGTYENDEFAQVLLSVDGTLYGAGGADYVAQLTGDGNGGRAHDRHRRLQQQEDLRRRIRRDPDRRCPVHRRNPGRPQR